MMERWKIQEKTSNSGALAMTGLKRTALILLLSVLLTGCAVRGGEVGADALPPAEEPAEETAQFPAPAYDPAAELAETILAEMTLPEKVGQLFFVRPDALDPTRNTTEIDDSRTSGVQTFSEPIRDMLERIPVGGVVLFGKNIASPDLLSAFLGDMQSASKVPLIFAVDEESGAVSRVGSNPAFEVPRYPNAAEIGAGQDPEAARRMGRGIGEYLAMYGFAMDFAPVADVRTNRSNRVIGDRAFSADPETVSAMAGAMAEGLLSRGIVPVYKHFPGHGDTEEDSHMGLAVLNKTKEALWDCEWLPYRENDLAGCAVMVGHIAVPALTGDMRPASLSETMVSGCLRGVLGFDGLVITDALSMGAVANYYTPGQAAVMALKAGCDVLLTPWDLTMAYDAVLAAAEDGEIPESRIDESVRRILVCKGRIGLLG